MGLPLRLGADSSVGRGGTPAVRVCHARGSDHLQVSFHGSPEFPARPYDSREVRCRFPVRRDTYWSWVRGECGWIWMDKRGVPQTLARIPRHNGSKVAERIALHGWCGAKMRSLKSIASPFGRAVRYAAF